MRRLAPLLFALALAGCGSVAAAELPAPAGPPRSPALTEEPFGRVAAGPAPAKAVTWAGVTFAVDRETDELRVGGKTARTCREPIAVGVLERGKGAAVLCGRERVVEVFDARTLQKRGSAPAGIGPTDLATDLVEVLYVIDALGEALLVYHLRPFELIRRVHLGGGPYAIAFDRGRWGLWMTLNARNQLAYYSAGTRPVIRDTLPSIRDARDVAVDGGLVTVSSRTERQALRLARTR